MWYMYALTNCRRLRLPMSQMFQIHGQLREMILSLDLAPGERLTERWPRKPL